MTNPTPRSLSFALVFVSVLFGCWIVGTLAGSCQPWIEQPTACAAFLTNQTIYVPDNYTQLDLLNAAIPALSVAAEFSVFPYCQLYYLEWVCLSAFPTCANAEFVGTLLEFVVPKPICQETCQEYVWACSEPYQLAGEASAIPNCAVTYPNDTLVYGGLMVYPDNGYTWDLGPNDTLETPCNFFPQSITCPPYYSLNDDPDTMMTAPCLPSCPNAAYTDAQYDGIYATTTIGAGLTIIAGAITLPPYLLRRERWKWPQQINIWIVFCSWLTGATYIIGLIIEKNDFTNIVCQTDVFYADLTHTICGIQGVWGNYWAFAGLMWWFGACMNLALTVAHVVVRKRVQAVFWHMMAWWVPLIALISAVSQNTILGAGAGSIGCGYTGAENNWWFQSLFYIPAMLLWILCFFALIFVVIQLIRLEGVKGLWRQIRLIIFIITSFWPILFGAIFFYVTQSDEDKITYDLSQFFLCAAASTPDTVSACDQWRNPPNYPAFTINYINIGFMPLIWVLIFGISPAVWNWYKMLIIGILRCDWKNVTHWWSHYDSSSSGSSGTMRSMKGMSTSMRSMKSMSGSMRNVGGSMRNLRGSQQNVRTRSVRAVRRGPSSRSVASELS